MASSELFVAICIDRHIDEVVRVFSTLDKAVQFCNDFMEDEDDIVIEELTPSMTKDGLLYYATYGSEGDSVRVERRNLDDSEF